MIPFKKIMRQIENSEAYVNVYPLLLSLTVTQLPHLFSALGTFSEEEHNRKDELRTNHEGKFRASQLMWQLNQIDDAAVWPPSLETIETLLLQSLENPPISLMVLEWLKARTAEELEVYATPILSTCFPLLLDEDVEPRIVVTFRGCWDILSTVIPQQLWVAAVNLLVQSPGGLSEE